MIYTALNNMEQKNAMRLQSIGIVQGTPAAELKAGDTMMWNWGFKSTVKEVVTAGAKSITIVEVSSTGTEYTRTFRNTRLVCILK